jgi:16S rRNA (cytosine1402-N4)-methyltransferase
MVAEVLELLAINPGSTVVDATAGAGGHLRLLAEAVGPTGRIFGVDQDDRAHQSDAAGGVAKDFPGTVKLLRGRFSEIPELLKEREVDGVDALLCDLGVSSMQLDEPDRGFSFRSDGPLDMRMGDDGMTAREFLTHSSVEELADVLFHYGEERRSRQIARAIKSVQPLPDSTAFLAKTVLQATGGQRGRIHPATRTFQAIRIAVNRELDELDKILETLPSILRPGARAAFISFHSLEDRKVKRCFQKGARETDGEGPFWSLLTKKPLVATKQECAKNPRSRSAKLRAVECHQC